mgnify:FL=1
MPTQKLSGAVSVWSNSPYTPTGYGVQVSHLLPLLKRAGLDVAMLSNYGLEGSKQNIKTPYGKIPHFPRGHDAYSNDVAPTDHLVWAKLHADKPNLFISLYDVWVMTSPRYGELDKIASWTPIDHVTMPTKVEAHSRKKNVHPIAMAPNGVREFEAKGIEHSYIPHSVNTKVIKPTYKLANGMAVEDYFKSKDKFVVGMVAANKASGMVHRKAFSENLLAFKLFQKDHADAILYIHTDPAFIQGWNLMQLLDSCGIDPETVMFPNPLDYRFGVDPKHLAALYTGIDVLLAPSYGEGFGVPTIEAQACGTRVIGSGWAATPDLVSDDCWLVEGQPQWDSAQNAWWQIPKVGSIVAALKLAYAEGKTKSDKSIQLAKIYDVENVWKNHWLPTLNKLLPQD